MHFFAFAALAILGSASARTLPRQVTQVPINNTVSPEVALKSGGNVPNAPPPANISTNGVASFQAALYLENFEVGFFNEGLYNLTHLWGSKNDLVEVFEVIDAVRLKFIFLPPPQDYRVNASFSKNKSTSPQSLV